MKARDIQARVTELFGDKVIAFTKGDNRIFRISDHDVIDLFWLHYRRDGKYIEVAIPVELFESEENWQPGWNERIDYLFSLVQKRAEGKP